MAGAAQAQTAGPASAASTSGLGTEGGGAPPAAAAASEGEGVADCWGALLIEHGPGWRPFFAAPVRGASAARPDVFALGKGPSGRAVVRLASREPGR
jgi:hypothetical protein